MADDMKANGSSQQSRRPRRRKLPPDGDESSGFMSADEDEGDVGVLGMNGPIGGTEDEIEMSSDSEDEQDDVGGLDGVNETRSQRIAANANTDLDAEDAWWAGLSSRTDETVARIMRSYGSRPSRSQEVVEHGDGGHISTEDWEGVDGGEEGQEDEKILVPAQPDEDETQVVQDSMVLDTEQPQATIGVEDLDSGHGSMAESDVGMLNVDIETNDQEVHTAPETPNDWQPMSESQQDRMDAAEETVRRIQAERNGNAANAAEQVREHDAGTAISPVKPAAVKFSSSQDRGKQRQATRRPSKKEKKERKWRREQQKLGLAIQKSNDDAERKDSAFTTGGAVSSEKELSSGRAGEDGIRAESNEDLKDEGLENDGMTKGGTRIETGENAKNRQKAEAKEERRIQCDSATRYAKKRRVRREKRRAEREAAARPKFNGHAEGRVKAGKKSRNERKKKERRQAGLEAAEGAKVALKEERKRRKMERRRAKVEASAGGARLDGHGGGEEGLTVEA